MRSWQALGFVADGHRDNDSSRWQVLQMLSGSSSADESSFSLFPLLHRYDKSNALLPSWRCCPAGAGRESRIFSPEKKIQPSNAGPCSAECWPTAHAQ